MSEMRREINKGWRVLSYADRLCRTWSVEFNVPSDANPTQIRAIHRLIDEFLRWNDEIKSFEIRRLFDRDAEFCADDKTLIFDMTCGDFGDDEDLWRHEFTRTHVHALIGPRGKIERTKLH